MIDVTQHRGLVTLLADRYVNLGYPRNERDDLIGEGFVALVEAGRDFDADPEHFPNFACQRIGRAMERYLMSCHYELLEYVGNDADLEAKTLNLWRPYR